MPEKRPLRTLPQFDFPDDREDYYRVCIYDDFANLKATLPVPYH